MSTFVITTSIPLDRVRSLLCCAFEGGSNYWYYNLQLTALPTDVSREDLREDGSAQPPDEYWHWSQLVPTLDGGVISFDDREEDETHTLNRTKLRQGLEILSANYPQHWADFLAENEDAATGDAFLQCCIFGDVQYG